jgi:hypothetical protein
MSADTVLSHLSKRTSDDCVSIGVLHSRFFLDPVSGIVSRKVARGNRKAGSIVGTKSMPFGHLTVEINKKSFLVHRVVWALYYSEWPMLDIDHINGIPDDNRIANLRLATVSQNLANSKVYKSNHLGVRGVRKVTDSRYMARIRVMGRGIYLGTFPTAADASKAYTEAASKYFGEFARAN